MYKHFILFLPVITLVAGALIVSPAKASTAGSWLNSDLNTKKTGSTSKLPDTLNGGNIDCAKIDDSVCSVPAAYGSAGGSGIRLYSDSQYKPLLSYLELQPKVMAVPKTSKLISFISSPAFGFYLYFNQMISAHEADTYIGGKTQKAYQIDIPPDGSFADRSGQRLRADLGSINYSANGQWMVVTIPNIAFARVNLQTYEVLPFGYALPYGTGLSPAPKTAISNDGRFATVDSKELGSFKLYDLSTCAEVPNTIYGPVDCQSRDMESTIRKQVAGFEFIYKARFLSDNLLEIYTKNLAPNEPAISRLLVSSAEINSQVEYLALGDSFISGEGAFNYQAGTDTENNHCHLSYSSYPHLIGISLNLSSYFSVACSGAVVSDIIDTNIPNGDKLPQSKGKNDKELDPEIYTGFLPGYRAQLNFVNHYQPKVITLSIGGNDMGFSKILMRCMEADNCYSAYEDRVELVREINNIVYPSLVETYSELKNAGQPDTRIYVIGYPQIAKPNGDCADNVRLDNEEVSFSQEIISYLDTVIKSAADKVGVKYVDMQDAFDGYRLCETKKGYSAMNGITAGDDRPFSLGPIGAESYHPTRLGYQLLEDKILSATNNLSSQMPSPDTSADLPSETGLEILNAPKSGRPINAINYDDDVANDVQYRGGAWNITYKSGKFLFKPASKVKVYLKSDPVFLGEFDTDQSGNVDIEVNASVDIPTGFHTLHIYGTNIVGQPVDIQKVIYVNDKPTTEAYAEPEETEATAVPANIESNTPASPQNTGSDNSASQSGQKLANASSLQNAAPNAASSAADNHGKVLGLATSKSLKQATNKENVTLSSFNLLSKNWPVTSTLLSITAVALIFILWRRTLAV